MIRLGLTGGIGSGKSWVAGILEQQHIPVYIADIRAKILMHEAPELRAGISRLFGKEAWLSDGQLNRKHIGSIVFQVPEMLDKLNALVHPATRADFEQWCENKARTGASLVVKEAAILYESGSQHGLDAVCMVYAPLKIRVQRVMKRDQVTEAQVLTRIANQWSDLRKSLLSDYIIFNDGVHPLEPQVENMLARLCSTGSSH